MKINTASVIGIIKSHSIGLSLKLVKNTLYIKKI